MELGFIEPEGGLLIREESEDIDEWDGGLVGGKEPMWLLPPKCEESLRCSSCERDLMFLCQIYAPLDEPSDAFHRDLSVFVCVSCSASVCIRSQAPEESQQANSTAITRKGWHLQNYAPSTHIELRQALVVESESDKEDEASSDEEEDEEEQQPPTKRICKMCDKPGKFRCGRCQVVYYCGREHQVADWRGGHKQTCGEVSDEAFSQADLDRIASRGNEQQLENLQQSKDKYFQRFTRKTSTHPDQVLRYSRWMEDPSKILWLDKRGRLDQPPPPCELCGSERRFEFQVLPQLLNYVSVDAVDFGTIVVYTCTKSCQLPNGFCTEFAFRQQV